VISPNKKPPEIETKTLRLADFSMGLNTTISGSLLNNNELQVAEDVSFEQKGTIMPRRGRRKRYEEEFSDSPCCGLGSYYKKDGTTKLLFAAGDKLYSDSPNMSFKWDNQNDWEEPNSKQANLDSSTTPGDIQIKEYTQTVPTFTRDSVAYLSDGTEVASGQPRFEDGKFGKGVLIEEGTTNLVSNPDFEGGTDGWILSTAAARSNAASYIGSYSLALTNPAWPQESTYNITGIAPSTAYTFSVYVKSSLSFIRINVVDLNGTTRLNTDVRNVSIHSAENNNTWKRYTLTWTTDANADGVQIRIICGESGNSGVAYLDGFQLEQKPYATPFVNGTRRGVLKAPTTGLSASQGTISFRAKNLAESANNSVLVDLPKSDNSQGLRAGIANDGKVYLTDNTTTVYGPNKSTLTGWDSISLAWKSERLSLVVNDSEACYIENPGIPTVFGSYLFIGTDRNGNNAINTLVDELRIDKVYRDVATRTAWHKTGVPFYTSEDMKQWPGYVKVETDGLKVYDAADDLRVLVGSWMNGLLREYGIKIIRGLIEASTISGGSIDIIREVGEAGRVHIENGKISMFAESDNEGEFLCLSLEPFKSWGGTIRFYYFDENTHQTEASARIVGGDGELAIVGDVVILGDFEVTGRKDCVEQTENYGTVVLSARESPEIRYIDEGVGTLINGECRIDIDPIFMECIEPNTEYSRWYIHLTPYADVDIYVAEIGENYFVVKEKKNGTSTGADFTWSLSAIRKNYAGIRLMEVTN